MTGVAPAANPTQLDTTKRQLPNLITDVAKIGLWEIAYGVRIDLSGLKGDIVHHCAMSRRSDSSDSRHHAITDTAGSD